MSRALRTLLLTQLVTALTGTAIAAHAAPRPTAAERPATVTHVVVRPVAEAVTRPAVIPKRALPKAHAPRTAAKPTPVRRPAPRRHPRVRHTAPARPAVPVLTPLLRMQQAVARIPGYPRGGALWVLAEKDGFWGTADWYHGVIYVSPRVPANRVYDVVVHEWSHLLSVRDYGNDVPTATDAMNAWFGGSDLVGAERAADCMARELGASWTHYTSCDNPTWRKGAARLLAGQQL
ncbi:MAG: hypothetical protein WCD35_01810 [Mycobacteriales bacterium]